MKRILAVAALGFAAIGLSACGESAEQVAEAPDGVPGMSVENARMVLNAVEGNPAAIYFDLKYEGDRALSLSRAMVEGAESAVMHDYGEYDFKVQMMEALPIPLTKGSEVVFEPGAKHVMAMGVSPEITPGDSVEVTLFVSGGDKYSFDAEVLAAGDER